ncbi:MAG TPA: hypothetical protein PK941_08005, partial [Paludibacter sp.]|nr:hypothetical protein [Paludibacter sp.]
SRTKLHSKENPKNVAKVSGKEKEFCFSRTKLHSKENPKNVAKVSAEAKIKGPTRFWAVERIDTATSID